jgi:hypothetical protein
VSDADESAAGEIADALARSQAEERAEQEEDIRREQGLIDRLVASLSRRNRSEA